MRKAIKGRPLSETELKVLRCVCNGDNDKEVAVKLKLTESSVKGNLCRIRDKLNFTGQAGNRVRFVLMVLRDKELVQLMRESRAREGEAKQ
jgi:DNA-binding NarL/FixJ family response regulator